MLLLLGTSEQCCGALACLLKIAPRLIAKLLLVYFLPFCAAILSLRAFNLIKPVASA